MTLSRTFSVFLIFVSALPAAGYEVINHMDMSSTALLRLTTLVTDQSSNNTSPDGKLFRLGLKQTPLNSDNPEVTSRFQKFPKNGPSTTECIFPDPDQSIINLIRYGACYEDNAEAGAYRPFAHFYDPQHGGRGLTVGGVSAGPSSPEWALNAVASGALTGTNHLSYVSARQAFYKALTRRELGFTAEQNNQLRREDWGITFQALGHVVHHLQDMAQPQHVRNDQHCDGTTVPCGPINNTSGYEKFWQERANTIRSLAATATVPILFGLPREFWNVNIDDQLRTTNAPDHMSPQSGLAAYTSTNFVSAGTDFTIERNGATRTHLPAYDFGLPRPAPLPNDVSLATLFADSTAATQEQIRTKVCGGDLATCKMRFYGSEVDPTARKSAISYFSQEYLGAATTPTRGRAGYFTQNYWTYADAATKLIPKAVEYSAGLINYFFRGEMEIRLPEEGVYGIVDHAVTNAKGDGYKLIKMRVKNVTADITTAIAPTRPTGLSKQDMTAGQFVAVAKFHRNTCYTPDLAGQIGQPGKGVDCRSATEEIVLSAPGTEVVGSAAVMATALAAGAEKTLAFDFTGSPVPIEATDLFLQVVFKGTLGEEPGAVAVTTKDISEPSFYTYMNSLDAGYTCPPNVPVATNPVSCSPRGAVEVKDISDTYNYYYRAPGIRGGPRGVITGTPVPALNRWMGFSSQDPAVKVVEWGGFFPVPGAAAAYGGYAYGIPAGSFSRVSFLADLSEPSAANDANHDKDEVTANNGLSWAWLQQPDATKPCGLAYVDVRVQPALAKVARVQSSEDDTLGSATNPLPEYLTLRGITLGLNAYDWRGRSQYANRQSAVGGLYASVAYSGELFGLLAISFADEQVALDALPRRGSVLTQLPPLPNLAPVPLYGLHFYPDRVRRVAAPTCTDFFNWLGGTAPGYYVPNNGYNALVKDAWGSKL